jgi:hypothetical protein
MPKVLVQQFYEDDAEFVELGEPREIIVTDAELDLLESARVIIFLEALDGISRLPAQTSSQPETLAMLTFLLTIIAAGIGAYFSTYLREKGKNLATKEDIGEITRIIEEVKHGHAKIIEEIKNAHATQLEVLKSRQQLRMAAIDKRLQAHQEVFALWKELYAVARDEDASVIVEKCDKWWVNNCLYLEPQAREAFGEALAEALNALHARDSEKILKAANVIVKAVELPALSEGEIQRLTMPPFSKPISPTFRGEEGQAPAEHRLE